MTWLFLALVFGAELAAWSAIGVSVFRLAGGGPRGWVLAVVAVLVTIIAWGLLAAPKAASSDSVRLATKVVVFGGSVALLAFARLPWWALALAAVIVVAHVGVVAVGDSD